VIGVPDRIKGEAPIVFAVYNGAKLSEEIKKEIIGQIQKGIGPIALPKEVYLVEGSPDVWSMKEMNKDNTVGIWGVANFKKNWVSDFAGKHVIIIMDNDVAGVNALVFLAEVMNEYKVSFEIRTVPAEFNDINDYLIWKKFKKKKDNKKMKEYLEIIQTEEYAKLKPYIRNAA